MNRKQKPNARYLYTSQGIIEDYTPQRYAIMPDDSARAFFIMLLISAALITALYIVL